MAHDHNYSITFLKTPYGFLTKEGYFTQDINSNDILMLASNSYGKWASRTSRISYFCKYANVGEDIIKELCEREDETETYTYLCHTNGTQCIYGKCKRKAICDFWNGNREKVKLSRIF